MSSITIGLGLMLLFVVCPILMGIVNSNYTEEPEIIIIRDADGHIVQILEEI